MSRDSYSVSFIGNHSKQVLSHLLEQGWNVSSVVGPAEAAVASDPVFESMAPVCSTHAVPLIRTDDIDAERVRDRVSEFDPDLGLCCGWTDFISEDLRELPSDGTIGFHFSHLPAGRGGAPVNWQIIEGRDTVGLSCFQLVEELDDGPIYASDSVPVQPRDDVATVYNRLTATTCRVLDDVLPRFEAGTIEGQPNPIDEATYYPQRRPDDGIIDWSWSGKSLVDWIRAQTKPYPGAFTFFEGERLTIWDGALESESAAASPGTIEAITPGAGVTIATGDDALQLRRVQPAGHPPMWADDFAEEFGCKAGDRIGTMDQYPPWFYTGIRGVESPGAFETNLHVGDHTSVEAVVCSSREQAPVTITAEVDGDPVYEESLSVEGWTRTVVPVRLENPGSHTVVVHFEKGGEHQDRRVLKVYAYE
jgi:methionyl-tRNA formyltransferase